MSAMGLHIPTGRSRSRTRPTTSDKRGLERRKSLSCVVVAENWKDVPATD
jgi:hypothetical protein